MASRSLYRLSMNNNSVPTLTVEERIFQAVAEKAEEPRETLDRDTVLAIVLLDSLGIMDLIMALEDEFELSLPDEEAENIKTIGQLIDAIETKLRTLAATPTPDGTDAPPSP